MRSREKLIATVAIFLAICDSSTPAAAATFKYQDTVSLGDNDSRSSARERALSRMKLRAAESVGTFVESEKIYSSHIDQFEHKVRMISAAMVVITDVRERLELSADGTARLEVTATVSVDEAELRRRAATIVQDKEKDKAIALLLAKNQQMQRELQTLSTPSQAAVRDASSQTTYLQTALVRNMNAVTLMFAKGALSRDIAKNEKLAAELRAGFTTEYLAAWKILADAMVPQLHSSFRNGESFEVIVVLPNRADKYTIANRLLGTSMSELPGKQWATATRLLASREDPGALLEKLSVIDAMPVCIRVSLQGQHLDVPYFGIGLEDFMGNGISPDRLDHRGFRQALLGGGVSKQAVGFFSTYGDNKRYWFSQKQIFVKFFLSPGQLAEADQVDVELTDCKSAQPASARASHMD